MQEDDLNLNNKLNLNAILIESGVKPVGNKVEKALSWVDRLFTFKPALSDHLAYGQISRFFDSIKSEIAAQHQKKELSLKNSDVVNAEVAGSALKILLDNFELIFMRTNSYFLKRSDVTSIMKNYFEKKPKSFNALKDIYVESLVDDHMNLYPADDRNKIAKNFSSSANILKDNIEYTVLNSYDNAKIRVSPRPDKVTKELENNVGKSR